MSVTLVCDDSFTHADTSFGSGANSTTGVPTTGGTAYGWIDVAGGDYKIVSDQLNAKNNSGASGASPGILRRPTSEDSQEQKIITYGPLYGVGDDQRSGILARIQSNNDCYVLEVLQGYTLVYKSVGGSQTSIQGLTGWNLGSYVTGHTYSCTFYLSAPSSGTTTISYTITDVTSSTNVATGSGITDSETTLQNAGGVGVGVWDNGVNNTYIVTRIQTYAGARTWSVTGSTTMTLEPGAYPGALHSLSSTTSLVAHAACVKAGDRIVIAATNFLLGTAGYNGWRLVVDDNFSSGNTPLYISAPPYGSVPSTSGFNNSPWSGTGSPLLGTGYFIDSGSLTICPTAGSFAAGQLLSRPASENSVAGRFVIDIPGSSIVGPDNPQPLFAGCLRYQPSSGSFYSIGITTSGSSWYISAARITNAGSTAPTVTVIGASALSSALSPGINVAHNYELDVSVSAPVSGVSTFTVTVTDVTASAVVFGPTTFTDSFAPLRSPGAFAIVSSTYESTAGLSCSVSRVRTYVLGTSYQFFPSATTSVFSDGWDLPLSVVENFPARLTRSCVTDSFSHPDTSPGVTANSTSGVPTAGGQWYDKTGYVWSISGGRLRGDMRQGNIAGSTPSSMEALLRPPTEDALTQGFTASTTYLPGFNDSSLIFGLRYQRSSGNFYFAQMSVNASSASSVGPLTGGLVSVGKCVWGLVSGVSVPIQTSLISNDDFYFPFVSGHVYSLSASCSKPTASGTTTITVSVFDENAGVLVYSNSVSDSEVSLQNPGAIFIGGSTIIGASPYVYVSSISTHIGFHPTAFAESALSSTNLSSAASIFANHVYIASALTSVVTHGSTASQSTNHLYFVGSTTHVALSQYAEPIGPKLVAASTGISLSGSNFTFHVGQHFISCATSISVTHSVTVIHNRQYLVSAAAAIAISYSCGKLLIGSHFLAAATSIVPVGSATEFSIGQKLLSASTQMFMIPLNSENFDRGITAPALEYVWIDGAFEYVPKDNIILVCAGSAYVTPTLIHLSDSVVLADRATAYATGNKTLSARTQLSAGVVCSALGTYEATALTGIVLATSIGTNYVRIMGASTAMLVLGVGLQVRDIHSSATTSMGLSQHEKNPLFYFTTQTTGVNLSETATVVAGHPAGNNTIAIVDLARATRVLSWRPAGLSLSPGGFSPHA